METKQWYLSRTIWSQFVAIVGLGLSFTGVIKLDEAIQGDIIDTIMAIVTICSQVAAIYYRIKANKPLV